MVMTTTQMQQSPLMHSSAGLPSQKPKGAANEGPSSFWVKDNYYTSDGIYHWGHSMDEEFDEPLRFPAGTVFVVDAVEDRPMCLGDDSDDSDVINSIYVILRTLDPRDPTACKTLRLGFWCSGAPGSRGGYTLIEEPLVILALAGTGQAP